MSPEHDIPYTSAVQGGSAPPPRGRGFGFSTRGDATRAGITMGSTIAIVISWSLHKSILWAIIHGFFSWGYVVYYALTRA